MPDCHTPHHSLLSLQHSGQGLLPFVTVLVQNISWDVNLSQGRKQQTKGIVDSKKKHLYPAHHPYSSYLLASDLVQEAFDGRDHVLIIFVLLGPGVTVGG